MWIKKVKLYITEDCIWCGACIAIWENIFKFNNNNICEPKNQPESDKDIQTAYEAAWACPVWAIIVEEEIV